MKDIVFQDYSLVDLPSVARKILQEYPDERIFAFFGELGTGKTTLIKSLCAALGSTDEVTSPSFA
ncbi:MAG: tRNA (adenosine(37)-N6)-threonylcarbamoyltransferase complex ATPase subunit type 1 TsaE, partial [Bacteroidales bacterium]|nr:tRNA (adenosine(37)-N6)-threonylcarbamoyltransferase complex ATPase subunit type 1 TsaE [Bacteroidales bacterium]